VRCGLSFILRKVWSKSTANERAWF
jgi:hypothetical protein